MPFRVVTPRQRVVVRVAALCLFSVSVAACSSDVARFEGGPQQRTAQRYPSALETTGSVQDQRGHAPRYESQAPIERQQLPEAPQQSYNPPPAQPRQASAAPAQMKHAAQPRQLAAMRNSQPSAPAPARSSGVHVATAKDSLGSIAQQYGRTRAEVAAANSLKATDKIKAGQRLIIPGVPQSQIKTAAAEPAKPAAPAQKIAAAQPNAKTTTPAQKTAAAPGKPEKPMQVASVQRGAAPANLKEPERVEKANLASPNQTAAPEKEAPAATGATSASFRWPVRGRVVAGFGPKGNGEKNEGINLAVPEGTSVKAAEDGVVAYSGNELKGYGNLVLVRHANGYVTAYAHASELKVKRGETVKRGQIIANAGQTGNVSSPQLHFEVRKGSTPVDPMPYLNGN
ncbi:murein hydrolase activator NlpD precursor [Variibacter gotjawalensis]|uniref:Murein hydrolase activator NlpD n=1 Tax=Variibacter gotjawalensis TaxID=1333996 RepID=A0A0S3PWN8_9BRAD|nr:peptidoglycan DD-metalloendopeptidase family protein [Variibacter gotjawalensis]NIK46183.1 murein DD-endopeptidase MepM/ murein hydrolase activator NlpD [Variibacter gotjawalensis]RZS48100.1 murein DD-endopeptidase MepM/ murein hydrolase activator NlpD [Variibacter gotjawalensis]BAT60357.1 murein hydrolase activator NlpD precursor [Variibacter gotjawalensis]